MPSAEHCPPGSGQWDLVHEKSMTQGKVKMIQTYGELVSVFLHDIYILVIYM